jgi:hypothetical protein
MKKHLKPLVVLSVIIALLLLNMSCSSDEDNNTITIKETALKVQLANNTVYGSIMVNQN